MEKFIIHGGQKLHGSVRLGGAKNASFKLMVASLLTNGETRLLNIPHIKDVEITREIIASLGGKISSAGEKMLCLHTSSLNSHIIPEKYGRESRASSLFIGPLLYRFGKAQIPFPGGDKIGKRPLDRHFEGIASLGVRIESRNGNLFFSSKNLVGTQYRFKKNTHTGTESMIMAAVISKGKTVLKNVALEPEVDDLIIMLNSMGARIRRRPNRMLEINGVKKLKPAIHRIMPDRNEAVTYACAAIATRGDIIVENARQEHLKAFLLKLAEAGGGYEVGPFGIRFYYKQPLNAVHIITRPHPGFMTDWQPLWCVLMTQAKGTSTIHESIHTNRFQYVKPLLEMGADIELYNPPVKNPVHFYNFNLEDGRNEFKHAVKIQGPTPLMGKDLVVHDLRAGATLVLAALIAKGRSSILGADQIDRGYENLDGRLIDLGAKIKRV